MRLNENYGTLSETLNELKKQGYTIDFNIHSECLVCHQTNIVLQPEEFQIDMVYRFEGASDPDDQSIVYAISSPKFNVKGSLVNGYGIFAEEMPSKLIEKLQTHAAPHSTKEKSIDATPQRKEGGRVIEAPLVGINIPEFIEIIKREPTWKDSDHNSVTVFKSERMRIVLMGLHKGGQLKPHKANGVISVQVLEGSIEFVTEEDKVTLRKGQMIALQENITHSVVALEESFFLLTLAKG